jgi:arabinan endo-1,5-alpha-L-arabinosidase
MQLFGKGAVGPRSWGFLSLVVLALGVAGPPAAAASLTATVYRNPVSRSFAGTYADPDVVRSSDGWWFAYATTDPLRSRERTPHYIAMSESRDLVHWQYAGDAFTGATLPSWADTAHGAALWAPDVHYADGQWRMYYVVTQTAVTPGLNDNAIGMATAPTPLGPWTDSGGPVVGPRHGANAADPNDWLWTFDPEVARDVDGTEHIFYGSYYGGVFQQPLDASGRHTTGPANRIAIDNKFEGTYLTHKGGYWYFFGSTANCCAGPTTGYSVEVARSRSLTGPYVDRDGLRIDVGGETGGTPVLYQNGNRWIGTGHNSMATDDAGQTWIVYHAIDRNNPFLDEPFGINRRPMLIDRLDWVNGWPIVRAGCGPSDSLQAGPLVRTTSASAPASAVASLTGAGGILADCPWDFAPGRPDGADSDEFDGASLDAGWQTVRSPAVTLSAGALRWVTERADLTGPGGTAGLLLRPAPNGDWTVETKLTLDLGTDEVRNFQQAGLIAYVNDDLFTRLSKVAIWNTRQIEFGKEMPYAGSLSYGGTIIGPPASTTWLRIVHRTNPTTGEHLLTAFSSRDSRHWARGGTWTLPAASQIRIGLESMGAGGQGAADVPPATAVFDYFRVFTH